MRATDLEFSETDDMICDLSGFKVNYVESGPSEGAPIIFAHALGANLHMWDAVAERLPQDLRLIRYDLRGHGGTDVTKPPYKMGQLVRDAEGLLDALAIKDAVFVGISLGGLIAQGLAVKRLDQIRALVLSNTAAKIGTRDIWQKRMRAVEKDGLSSLRQATGERWFRKDFRQGAVAQHWLDEVEKTDKDGYIGCCSAIGGTDLITPTSGLRLPCLGIAGGYDGSTPADLVRDLTDLIPGANLSLLHRSGHLPPLDAPDAFADELTKFCRSIGHVTRN